MMKIFTNIICLFLLVWLCGCASTPRPTPVYHPSDNGYTSAYPVRNISKKLSHIQQSVQRILSTAIYEVYYMRGNHVALADILNKDISTLAAFKKSVTKSNAGTAISILQNDEYTLFITAYHVIASADTILAYEKNTPGISDPGLKSISIRRSNKTYLISGSSLFELKPIAIDPRNDLALLIVKNDIYNFHSPSLSIQTGAGKDLKLGSVIYILGYPLGNPMVTNGIVSAPNFNDQGSFLTDALFNHGISGGLIIASNDLYQTFEWVGMSSTASVNRKSLLVPNPKTQFTYNDFDIYSDSINIDQMNFINYGVSRATPIEAILEFIYAHEEKLNNFGMSASDLVGQ